MKIDRDQIIAEALRLLDDVGLDGLTTRALAERLGVKQPALYWHFKDRRALLDALNEAMLAGATADPPPRDLPWQDYVQRIGQDFRCALMSRRDGARIHAGTRENHALLERHMQVLLDAGLPMPLAVQLLVSLSRLIVGWVLEEQAKAASPSAAPNAQSAPSGLAGRAIGALVEMGDDAAFAAGLRFLIAGAAAEAERAKRGG